MKTITNFLSNFNFTISKKEIKDLTKAWIAISLAFTIVLNGFKLDVSFFTYLTTAALTVGTGFLLHELAHKITAQYYNYKAAFKANDLMLLLAIIFSFFGFVIAAPGAVHIQPTVDIYGNRKKISTRKNGIISLAGPWTNITLAVIFILLKYTFTSYTFIWDYGIQINLWLALFNLLPFGVFDGKKIKNWNTKIWVSTITTALILFFFL